MGGGGEPEAATTERLRSRKFNKRLPRWRRRRFQLAEPTGKAESEAAAPPIVPGASRAGEGAGPRRCPGGPRPAPPAGSRSAPGVYTLSFRHGIKFQDALEAPGAGHRPGRGEAPERDLRQQCADKARLAWALLVQRGWGEGKSTGQGGAAGRNLQPEASPSRWSGGLRSRWPENLALGGEGLLRTLAQGLLWAPLASSSPLPPSPFDVLPDSGHCWGGGGGLRARRGSRDWRPRASQRSLAPGLRRPRAECRRARRSAPPLSWPRAGAPRCQAAVGELPAAQAHRKQLRARPPSPGWEPHPNTMSPSLRLPAEARGGWGAGAGGGRRFCSRAWGKRAPTPSPGRRGPGASVLNLQGCGVLRGGEGVSACPLPTECLLCSGKQGKH